MHGVLFTPSYVSGHLGFVCFWAIVNSAAMNTSVQRSSSVLFCTLFLIPHPITLSALSPSDLTCNATSSKKLSLTLQTNLVDSAKAPSAPQRTAHCCCLLASPLACKFPMKGALPASSALCPSDLAQCLDHRTSLEVRTQPSGLVRSSVQCVRLPAASEAHSLTRCSLRHRLWFLL